MPSSYSLADYLGLLARTLEPVVQSWVGALYDVAEGSAGGPDAPESAKNRVVEKVLEDVPKWSADTRAYFVGPIVRDDWRARHLDAMARRCVQAQLAALGASKDDGVPTPDIDAADFVYAILRGVAGEVLENWDAGDSGAPTLLRPRMRPLLRRAIARGCREALDAATGDAVAELLSDLEHARAEYEREMREAEEAGGSSGEEGGEDSGDEEPGAVARETQTALADEDIDHMLDAEVARRDASLAAQGGGDDAGMHEDREGGGDGDLDQQQQQEGERVVKIDLDALPSAARALNTAPGPEW